MVIEINEYLCKIKPYLRSTIIDIQEFDTQKIQLNIVMKFISSKDTHKQREYAQRVIT